MLKKILIIVLVLIVAGGVLGALYFWNQISWSVSDDETTTLFTVSEGDGVKAIAQELVADGLIRNQFWFESYVWLDRSEGDFIAGNYILSPSMSTREIVHALTSGDTTPETTITIIEGWTVADIAEYLAGTGIVSADDFVSAASTGDSRKIIPDRVYAFLADKPIDEGLEGFLFPDTYRVFNTATSADIIKKMLDNFDEKFTEDMYAAALQRGMSVYDIVTLASIIEKEVRSDEDRKIVAGIFYDRLDLGVPLQSDATVNYVTGKQALQPTAADLEAESPYNTYQYKGLPPGPISNPSLSALMAALYPEQSDYFYFLTKPDGSTVFSKTYDEHLENKAKYLD